ncbi:MAG: hypothetical protein ACI83W_001458 [Marinoscillum sp.]
MFFTAPKGCYQKYCQQKERRLERSHHVNVTPKRQKTFMST